MVYDLCDCCDTRQCWFEEHIDPDDTYAEAIQNGEIRTEEDIQREVREYDQNIRPHEKLSPAQREAMAAELKRLVAKIRE